MLGTTAVRWPSKKVGVISGREAGILLAVTALHISDGKNPIGGAQLLSDRGKSKRLDRLLEVLRSRHSSHLTRQTHCRWFKRHLHFHSVRQTPEISEPEINTFPTRLAVKEKVSASPQNPALSIFLFLHCGVLRHEVGDLTEVIRARKSRGPPAPAARAEDCAGLAAL